MGRHKTVADGLSAWMHHNKRLFYAKSGEKLDKEKKYRPWLADSIDWRLLQRLLYRLIYRDYVEGQEAQQQIVAGEQALFDKALFSESECRLGVPALVTAGDVIPLDGASARIALLTYLQLVRHALGEQLFPGTVGLSFAKRAVVNETSSSPGSDCDCVVCGDKPYFLERCLMDSTMVFHRRCFSCRRCSRQLRKGTYRCTVEPDQSASNTTTTVTDGGTFECLEHEREDFCISLLESEPESTTAIILKRPVPPPVMAKPSRKSPENIQSSGNSVAMTAEETTMAPSENSTDSGFIREDDYAEIDLQQPMTSRDSTKDDVTSSQSTVVTDLDAITAKFDRDAAVEVEDKLSATPEAASTNDRASPPAVTVTGEDGGNCQPPLLVTDFDGETPVSKSVSVDELKVSLIDVAKDAAGDISDGAAVTEGKEDDRPVPPPRRRRQKANQSPRASPVNLPRPELKPKPEVKSKPVPPPKPKFVTSPTSNATVVKPPVKPRRRDIFDEYPDYLNPFGSEEEQTLSDSEDEDSRKSIASASYNEALNPFADDDAEPEVQIAPAPKPRYSMFEPMRDPTNRSQSSTDDHSKRLSTPLDGRRSLSPFSSLHRQKRRAPEAPLPGLSDRPKLKPPPTPPLVVKKQKRPAPPPPLPLKRKIEMDGAAKLTLGELSRELEVLDERQLRLETRAKELEKELLFLIVQEPNSWEKNVKVEEWLLAVDQKCELVRKEAALVQRWRELYLDDFHSDLEYQIRCIIEKPENAKKTDGDTAREAKLLQMMLEVIERKNRLVENYKPAAIVDWENEEEQLMQADQERKNEHKVKKKKLKLKIRMLKRKISEQQGTVADKN